ncbi:MAG TPA: ParB N-terminal domain-containing protein [Pirellulales bacterium]|nr:ParB N-terminal domain-containing protein [Pirellulales bacterium]
MSVSTAAIRQVVRRKLGWFKPKNIRKTFVEEDDRALGCSIRDIGQIHPLACGPDGTIFDGERRWRGAKLVELEELDVIIIEGELSDTDLLVLQISSALHRADLTAGEKYECVYQLAMRNTNWQAKDIAEHLNFDQGVISKLLSFSRIIPAGREALKDGRLKLDDGYLLSQLPEPEQAELLPLRLSRSIPNREALHAEVKARKTARKNGTVKQETGRFKATLDSGIVVTCSGPLKSLLDLEEAGKEIVKKAKHAREKEGVDDLKAFEVWLKAKSK